MDYIRPAADKLTAPAPLARDSITEFAERVNRVGSLNIESPSHARRLYCFPRATGAIRRGQVKTLIVFYSHHLAPIEPSFEVTVRESDSMKQDQRTYLMSKSGALPTHSELLMT
jgi:DNA-binding ferritin-like protein